MTDKKSKSRDSPLVHAYSDSPSALRYHVVLHASCMVWECSQYWHQRCWLTWKQSLMPSRFKHLTACRQSAFVSRCFCRLHRAKTCNSSGRGEGADQ
jgi:hypothetical protein